MSDVSDLCRYLLTSVLRTGLDTCSLQDLYDFLFDRLRAVRQDLTLQPASEDRLSLKILACCVRFHLVFGLLLRSHTTFSQHLNSQHQLDCLKSCLLLSPGPDCEEVASLQCLQEVAHLQCLYLLSNMDSQHALSWAVNIQHRTDLLGRDLGRSYSLVVSCNTEYTEKYREFQARFPLIFIIRSTKF